MARRQNHKLTRQRRATQQGFTLPDRISPEVPGMNREGMDFINTLLTSYRFGSDLFDTQTPHHEDWIMLFVILTNESEGRATVTKNIVEITGRAYGTVRASLQRFEELGFISPNQRIGRSELYVPTPALKKHINSFARSFWNEVGRTRAQKTRVKDPA